MSRIVIDARELRTSTGRYVERLLHYLQKIDNQNEYLILLKPQDMADWQPSASNFEKVACTHREFTFDEQFGLKWQLHSLKPDLVHFAMPQQPIWYRGKTVTTIHDLTTLRFDNPTKNQLVFKLKQRVYGYVIKRAARQSAAIITPSQFVKGDVVQFTGIKPSKITVTSEAADTITEKPEAMPELKGKKFIMYVGRPTPHKNLERLIGAFEELGARHPELVLVLAGKKDSNYRRIEAGVQNKNIIFTGFVSQGQLRWLYENCAAYVFPSLSEGFGLPGLEAMAHGAPVVSSSATCLPEVYGQAAYYFDPLSQPAMADAINEVLANKKLRVALIKEGRRQITKYSWQRTAEQTLAVYKQALK